MKCSFYPDAELVSSWRWQVLLDASDGQPRMLTISSAGSREGDAADGDGVYDPALDEEVAIVPVVADKAEMAEKQDTERVEKGHTHRKV